MKKLLFLAVVLAAGVASAETAWTKGTYSDDAYVEVGNRLNKKAGDNACDGNTITYSSIGSYKSYTYNYDDPVDLLSLSVYSTWKDNGRVGFAISNLMVRYEGSADFVELPGTDIDYYSIGAWPATNRLCATLADDSGRYVAERVAAVKVNFGMVQNNGIYIAELEVAGTPHVDEVLNNSCCVAAGRLTADISAVAHDYPAEIHFCTGATNGGNDPDDWDSDIVIGTIDSSEAKINYQGDATYAYGRFYFWSAAYGRVVWGSLMEVSDNPYAELKRVEPSSQSVDFEVALISSGLKDSVADVKFAYAPSGTELPTPAVVSAKVAPGGSVAHRVAGLEPFTSYDYAFTIVNAHGGRQTISGTVQTLTIGSWEVVPNITLDMPFVYPEHHLSGTMGGYAFDGVLDSYQERADSYCKLSPNMPLKFTFSRPHDLKSISLYMLFNGRAQIAFGDGIKVKYEGEDEYTTIPMSVLSAPADTTWRTYLVRFSGNGGCFATGVVELFLPPTFAQNGYCVANEVVLEGQPSDHDKVHWQFGAYPYAEYRPDTFALDSLVASRTNFDEREYDNDVNTCYYSPNASAADPFKDGVGRRTGHTYTWEFAKHVDMSGVEICTHGPISYGGRAEVAVEGLYVKYDRNGDFVRVPGTSLDRFNFVTSNHFARVVSSVQKQAFPLTGVVAAQLVLGTPMYGHVGFFISEVHPIGRLHKGLMLIVR